MIRKIRSNKDLTQQQLAAKCEVLGCSISRSTLAKIEAQIRRISDVELYTISRVLGVEMEDIFPSNPLKRLKNKR